MVEELTRTVVPVSSSDAPIALVNMPFWSTVTPSIQLGVLKAVLAQRNIPATVYYLNLPLARIIGYAPYNIVANVRSILLGEWLFSQAAFGPVQDDDQFLEEFAPTIAILKQQLGWTEHDLLDIKQRIVPAYIEACLEAIPWGKHSIVGFTSTFQQNTASLALARLLKEHLPGIKVVMGGANFDDEMGVEQIRAFHWIDYAVIGEGDVVFPKLVEELLSNQSVQPRPNRVII